MMSYLTLSLLNTKTFCWLMRLFLLNSGNLRLHIVMTSCISRWPARVLTSLVSPSNFVITPFGKANLLIIETFKPKSKSTWKSLWLLIGPIVLAVQMVTGDSCFGILMCWCIVMLVYCQMYIPDLPKYLVVIMLLCCYVVGCTYLIYLPTRGSSIDPPRTTTTTTMTTTHFKSFYIPDPEWPHDSS